MSVQLGPNVRTFRLYLLWIGHDWLYLYFEIENFVRTFGAKCLYNWAKCLYNWAVFAMDWLDLKNKYRRNVCTTWTQKVPKCLYN